MISIKKSFARCEICPLLGEPSCILETNCEDDLRNVEVIYVAENPGKTEVLANPPRPLIGKAGKIFREVFELHIKDNFRWLISNCVLCATIKDGKTINPTNEVIKICRENIFEIIRICQPNLIVLMGNSPLKAFEITKQPMMKVRGNFFKWENFDVLVTIHPSYINYGHLDLKEIFFEDIKLSGKFLLGEYSSKSENLVEMKKENKTGVYYYRLPDKYYAENSFLLDVQNLNQEVLFIFRIDGKKEFYRTSAEEYYYRNPEAHKPLVVPYDRLELCWKNQDTKPSPEDYESDIRITGKHACDYYLLRKKSEPENLKIRIMYFDIEIYGGDYEGFPDPSSAEYMICMASFYCDDKLKTYVVKHPDVKDEIDTLNGNVIILENEEKFLEAILKVIREEDYDVLTGWNINGFDLPYIFNRCKRLGIDPNKLSRFDSGVYIDGERLIANIPGIVCIDMLAQYRASTFTTRESYKLNTIASIELGEEKIALDQSFNEIYREDINRYIAYNRKDTELLKRLEDKLGYIKLQNEIRRICKTSFNCSLSSMGQINALFLSYLKERGLACKNAVSTEEEEKISGAYVKEPIPGLYQWFVDFDYASLYPSLILTYNLGINTLSLKFTDLQNGYLFIYDRENLPEVVEIIEDPTNNNIPKKISRDELISRVEKENLIVTINGCFYKSHETKSQFSEILEMLLSSRKKYKKRMLEEKEKGNLAKAEVFDTWQLVYKVLANACYGVLLNKHFRFFNPDIGRSITMSGEELTKTTIVYANNFTKSLLTGDPVEEFLITYKDILTDFDLSVPSPLVITSDTDSVFVDISQFVENLPDEEKISKIHQVCEKVQNYLNNEVVVRLVERHGVPKEHNRLSLKNELICKKGLFIRKKMYAIHVIQQEFKDVDEIIVKGLEIRRGDYPEFTKKKLSELLDLLLRENSIPIKKIYEFISKTGEIFKQLILRGDPSIARPVSFTKKVEEYKKTPPGILGMLAWNTLINNIFVPGTKGYLFKIKGVDVEKMPPEILERFNKFNDNLDVIVAPGKLPEFFIPDVEANLKFAWEDRYQHLLAPILRIEKEKDIIFF